ncbi:hypothetical protein ACFQHN_24555 [Natrialbaceae archaeon GCM10025896]
MTGDDAEANMGGFDFDETWDVVTDPDDYPALQWQEIDSGGDVAIAASRQAVDGELRTTVQSPITVQVMDPTGPDYEYHWRVADKPAGSDPGLLHGEDHKEVEWETDINTRRRAHAALRPDQTGEYDLHVEVYDGAGELLGEETTTIHVKEAELADYDVDFDIGDIDFADNEAELAQELAPVFHFHPDEQYFPTRYEAYVENSDLQINATDGGYNDGTTIEPDSDNDIDLTLVVLGADEDLQNTHGLFEDVSYNPSDDDNRLWLGGEDGSEEDFRGDENIWFGEGFQGQYPLTIHASVTNTIFDDERYLAITYWHFYLYDRKPSLASRLFSQHPSDTETVTILVNEDGPQWVAAAQHKSGEYMEWEKVVPESQLHIFPARGAHSSFLVNSALFESNIPGQERWIDEENDATSRIGFSTAYYDETASGREWSSENYHLVMLPGDQPDNRQDETRIGEAGWTSFGGDNDLDATPGSSLFNLAGVGELPMQLDRWEDPGNWINDRMLAEWEGEQTAWTGSNVMDADIDNVRVDMIEDSVNDGQFVIDVDNEGMKPHSFFVRAEVMLPNSDTPILTETNENQSEEFSGEPIAYKDSGAIGIPFEDVDQPKREYEVQFRLFGYDPDILEQLYSDVQFRERDILDDETRKTTLESASGPVFEAISIGFSIGDTT